jgi:hypothetical protein
VEASRFADLLRQARPVPRLVVLNSCSGAAGSAQDLFSGTAAALARSGVAAVAAMQFAISDPATVAFARGFYAALTRGRGVDEAVSAGRIAILGTSGQTLEWITPCAVPARPAHPPVHPPTRKYSPTVVRQQSATSGSGGPARWQVFTRPQSRAPAVPPGPHPHRPHQQRGDRGGVQPGRHPARHASDDNTARPWA